MLKEYGFDQIEIKQLYCFIGDEEMTFEEYYKDYINCNLDEI